MILSSFSNKRVKSLINVFEEYKIKYFEETPLVKFKNLNNFGISIHLDHYFIRKDIVSQYNLADGIELKLPKGEYIYQLGNIKTEQINPMSNPFVIFREFALIGKKDISKEKILEFSKKYGLLKNSIDIKALFTLNTFVDSKLWSAAQDENVSLTRFSIDHFYYYAREAYFVNEFYKYLNMYKGEIYGLALLRELLFSFYLYQKSFSIYKLFFDINNLIERYSIGKKDKVLDDFYSLFYRLIDEKLSADPLCDFYDEQVKLLLTKFLSKEQIFKLASDIISYALAIRVGSITFSADTRDYSPLFYADSQESDYKNLESINESLLEPIIECNDLLQCIWINFWIETTKKYYCLNCGEEISKIRRHKLYCSVNCRKKYNYDLENNVKRLHDDGKSIDEIAIATSTERKKIERKMELLGLT